MKPRKIRSQIIYAIILATLFATLATPVSYAQSSESAGYLCTSNMAVGFAYNNSLKKWEGVHLGLQGVFSKFTLRLKHLKDRARNNSAGEHEDISDYVATISEMGTSAAIPCTFGGTGINSRIIVVGDDDNLVCAAKRRRITFNLESGRFISAFLFGYVDGIESNDNMPTMSGGTCEKMIEK